MNGRVAVPSPLLGRNAVLEAHRELRAVLADVGALLILADDSRGFARTLDRSLARLQVLLEEHFAQEEDGGLFEQIAASAEAAPEADALGAEHRRLRARLGSLRERARAGLAPGARLSTAVRRFIRDLERHESRENAALLDVLEGGAAAQD